MKKFAIITIVLGLVAFLTVCMVNSVKALDKALLEKSERKNS